VEGASVHPRVRGEHLNSHKAGLWDDGSSPRIRGTLMAREWISVHPRACGEHELPHGHICAPTGSSPRMRGTRVPCVEARLSDRFIPAHAGNTDGAGMDCRVPSVHPRAYGEYEPSRSRQGQHLGSSPRMRGTRSACRRCAPRPRFIPAHAGNTDRKSNPTAR